MRLVNELSVNPLAPTDGVDAEVETADGELASCWAELVSILFCPYISYCVGKPCVGRQRVIETNYVEREYQWC